MGQQHDRTPTTRDAHRASFALASAERRREIAVVSGHSAPQSIAVRALPFRALAALVARSPMGGEREIAMACFMAARLLGPVADPPGGEAIPADARGERATAARAWLAGLAMPATLRTLFARVLDASATSDRAAMAERLEALTDSVARFLDEPAKAELDALAERLAS